MQRGVGEHTGMSALQQQQQHPLKSARGGYLRCPFSIQPVFAEMASRHAGEAFKGHVPSTVRGTEASGRENKECDDDEACRPWIRAGVGANMLSAKDRRLQQQDAERVYGPIAAVEGGEDLHAPVAFSSSSSTNQSTGVGAGLAVALSQSEKTALKRVLPRGVLRGKMQRNGESTETALEEDVVVASQHTQLASAGSDLNDTRHPSPAGRQRRKIENQEGLDVHPREVVVSARSQEVDEHPEKRENKPLNKLQRLDELRTAALFGGKKGPRRRKP